MPGRKKTGGDRRRDSDEKAGLGGGGGVLPSAENPESDSSDADADDDDDNFYPPEANVSFPDEPSSSTSKRDILEKFAKKLKIQYKEWSNTAGRRVIRCRNLKKIWKDDTRAALVLAKENPGFRDKLPLIDFLANHLVKIPTNELIELLNYENAYQRLNKEGVGQSEEEERGDQLLRLKGERNQKRDVLDAALDACERKIKLVRIVFALYVKYPTSFGNARRFVERNLVIPFISSYNANQGSYRIEAAQIRKINEASEKIAKEKTEFIREIDKLSTLAEDRKARKLEALFDAVEKYIITDISPMREVQYRSVIGKFKALVEKYKGKALASEGDRVIRLQLNALLGKETITDKLIKLIGMNGIIQDVDQLTRTFECLVANHSRIAMSKDIKVEFAGKQIPWSQWNFETLSRLFTDDRVRSILDRKPLTMSLSTPTPPRKKPDPAKGGEDDPRPGQGGGRKPDSDRPDEGGGRRPGPAFR